MAFIGAGQNNYTLFHLDNYTFGNKSPKPEKEHSVEARFARLRKRYEQEGMRRSVDGVLLVHKHNTLHLLLLQVGSAFFKLPGGRLKPGEDEIAGLKRKLTSKMAPEKMEEFAMQWQVGDCLGKFFRPNFETLMYPYCPPHIARPKEQKKLFLVPLPEKAFFSVPRNMKLIAVPLFEIHDHSHRYGPIISSIPALISRLNFTLDSPEVLHPHVRVAQEQQAPQQDGQASVYQS